MGKIPPILMSVTQLVKDIITEGNVGRAIDKQPFAGLNQDACNWLRRYLNPCEDQQLVLSGIPDRETGRAYIYNKMFMTNYNSSTFSSFNGILRNNSTYAGFQTSVTREGNPTELLFIRLPYIGISGLLIEKGTYNCVATTKVTCHYAVKIIYDPNFCSGGAYGSVDENDLYTKAEGIKARLMASGYTIFNNTGKLNINGNFVTSVFYPHTYGNTFINTSSAGSAVQNNVICGIPLSYDSVTGAGNFKTTRGEEGVYGVLGNFHPEFKYVNMDSLGFVESTDPGALERSQEYMFTLCEGNLRNPGLKINNFDDGFGYVLVDDIPCGHWIADDSWTWYGLVTAYTGDFSTVNFNIKVATVASLLVTPTSSLNSATVIQPPVTPQLTEFAADFTRGNLMVYPSSWNDWNKVWRGIKHSWGSFLGTANTALGVANAITKLLPKSVKSSKPTTTVVVNPAVKTKAVKSTRKTKAVKRTKKHK